MFFTAEEIIKATNAEVIKNETSKDETFSFSTDTRTIKSGEIYLPLKGENFDGEKFIDKSIEAGAFGYFFTNLENIKNNCKLILKVENTLKAYLELARYYRRKISPITVAITGSSGKTTTKEMAYSVSCEKFKTHKTQLNFNNEIGLCKTILSMPEDTKVLILEMGMRGFGEIELLTKYAEPDIAIIVNIGTAHIGRLGSRENIAKAKCEIVNHLKSEGTLIAHDDELIKKLNLKVKNTIYFSLDNAKILKREIGKTKFNYQSYDYELNTEGDYNVQNSLSIIELGKELGLTESEISNGLKKYKPIEKRWDIEKIKGYRVINDSYNANPESMKGVLKTVIDIYAPPILFVLGDMGELGENEVQYHKEIGKYLVKNIKTGVEVLTVGNLALNITEELNKAGFESKNFENNIKISRYILDNVKFGTTIILKASRSMKFEEIIERLKK